MNTNYTEVFCFENDRLKESVRRYNLFLVLFRKKLMSAENESSEDEEDEMGFGLFDNGYAPH